LELFADGGEEDFISRMIMESNEHRNRVR
jgi:hypothetical protein